MKILEVTRKEKGKPPRHLMEPGSSTEYAEYAEVKRKGPAKPGGLWIRD